MRWDSMISRQKTGLECWSELQRQFTWKEPPDLALLFVSSLFRAEYDELLHRIRVDMPDSVVFGCGADGVIGSGQEAEFQHALSLTVGWLPGVELQPFYLPVGSLPGPDDPPERWRELCKAPEANCQMLLADPFSCDAESLLAGLDYAYPRSHRIGGLASGARTPGGNVLFHGDAIRSDGCIGLSLSGDLRVASLVAQGCRPVGEPMIVTGSDGNVVFGLDNQPALEALAHTIKALSEADRTLARTSLFLGLGMGPNLEYEAGQFLIRHIVGFDAETEALLVGAELRRGMTVQFHLRDAKASSQDLEQTLEQHCAKEEETPAGGVLFSCLGRGEHLYGRPDHDSGLIQAKLGDLPLGGFFCNGEIGPVQGTTYLHTYTSCLGLFYPLES